MSRKKKERTSAFEGMPKRLTNLTNESGTSQEQHAKKLGISRQAFNNYLNGVSTPDATMLGRLAEHFGVSADYILGLSDNPSTVYDEKVASSVTGLSSEAISVLARMNVKGDDGWGGAFDEHRMTIDFINRVLSVASDNMARQKDFPVSTIFSEMEKFVTSNIRNLTIAVPSDLFNAERLKAMSIKDHDESMKKVKSVDLREENYKRLITFEGDAGMMEAYTSAELYRSRKMETIQEELNWFWEQQNPKEAKELKRRDYNALRELFEEDENNDNK